MWMAAKTQVQDIAMFITRIDISSAFDTIDRDELFRIVEEFLDEDDQRILSMLLAQTTLENKVENAQATTFESNIGSPQGGSISGPLFTLYFSRALQQIKDEMQKETIDCRDINPRWVEKMESSMPEEIVYADDCDFINEMEKTKNKIYEKAKEIMKSKNLLVKEEKTEYTTVKGGSKEEERELKNVIKLGSNLGDREDIQRRKELATIALAKNDAIWKNNWKTKLTTRIRLYETLVKSVLLYNCGTWGVSKDDQRKLNNFHRRQLRKVIGIQWPHKIPNNTLHKITRKNPLSITITESRWKLLGHILRLSADCPARKAMRYYFEERTNKIFRERRGTTIVGTLNEDIKRTKGDDITFPVTPLVSQVSLQNLYTKAKNRKLWSKIVQQAVQIPNDRDEACLIVIGRRKGYVT